MINSISLSSDANFLYLVDSGRVITFDLRKSEGVIVGKLNGQLCAISNLNKPRITEPGLTVALKSNDQYTLTYNASTQAFGLIGATDIIQTIIEPGNGDPKGSCALHLFSLEANNLLIRRKGDELLIDKLDR